ncbi:hypothetical protein PVAND_007776 [Polypedilum vanderplanki]|uniref:Uncharacterized protein n=1 Tax=Polypedilum vanderplanki TaxID=319348 RepID=A0A9J6C7Q8_POLVA|nr:hypothetical protein PVAND_007776 [Polypedilum vanderplanki]
MKLLLKIFIFISFYSSIESEENLRINERDFSKMGIEKILLRNKENNETPKMLPPPKYLLFLASILQIFGGVLACIGLAWLILNMIKCWLRRNHRDLSE